MTSFAKKQLSAASLFLLLSMQASATDAIDLFEKAFEPQSSSSFLDLTKDCSQHSIKQTECFLQVDGLTIGGIPLHAIRATSSEGSFAGFVMKASANIDDAGARSVFEALSTKYGLPESKSKVPNTVYQESEACQPVGRYVVSWSDGKAAKISMHVDIATIKNGDNTPFDVHDLTIEFAQRL